MEKHLDLLTFLEPLNEYDREEAFEEKYGHLNPNDPSTLTSLLESAFFLNPWVVESYTKELKKSLTFSLIAALQDNNFDFEWLIKESDGTFGLPHSWHVDDYRMIFEEIYEGVYNHWRTDLESIECKIPKPSEILRKDIL